MSRFACIVVAVVLFLPTGIAEGAVEFRFSVAGLASNMPAEVFDWSMHNYSGSAHETGAKLSDVSVTRVIDANSPTIMNAVILGTSYPSATVTFCKPSCAAPIDGASFLMEDVLLNSYTLGSTGGLPAESIGVNYSKMTANYNPTPTPPRTAWGGIMPSMLPAGGQPPYDFDFYIDALAAEDLLGRPLSPLGDTLPDTLYNISAVPEPSTLILLLAGMLALCSRRRLAGP
jgi:type VI protein secretion system component Hcp